MFQKMKLPAAIALFVQSITFFALFFVLWSKKKSLAGAFLAVSAMSGAACGCLVYELRKEIAQTTVELDDGLDIDEADLRADLSSDEEA